jgi:hypothetical protein
MRLVSIRVLIAAMAVLLAGTPGRAMVGDAEIVADARSRPEVMILGSGGTFCSGVAIAPDLVLTAGHCVMPGAIYKRVELDEKGKPLLWESVAVVQHPKFDIKSLFAHRATADFGLIKLKDPIAATPVPLALPRQRIAPGETFIVHGAWLRPVGARRPQLRSDLAGGTPGRDRASGFAAVAPDRSGHRGQEAGARRLHR